MKPFRDQVRASTASDWWVLNNRGRMRLQVKGVGSISLPYPWTLEGSTQGLPRIQQIFKRWANGQITLVQAAQSANTSSSHQQLNFTQLIDKYRQFVPNAGETTWKSFYLPVLRNCANVFNDRPPVDGEALCIACLKQSEQGSRMRQTSRQKLYGFLNPELGGSAWTPEAHLQPV